MDEQKKRRRGSLFVPGCLLIGLGIGIIFKNAGGGSLIGLGVGFIVWGILRMVNR